MKSTCCDYFLDHTTTVLTIQTMHLLFSYETALFSSLSSSLHAVCASGDHNLITDFKISPQREQNMITVPPDVLFNVCRGDDGSQRDSRFESSGLQGCFVDTGAAWS